VDKIRKPYEGRRDILLKDKCFFFNNELVETSEFDNILRQALTPMDSVYSRKESRGAHAREDYIERDDKNFMKHTLAWQKDKKVEIKYRDVHSRTLTIDVQYFPPKERVY
jgi:Succinate dehydrogenase/fumarate reductase, flavoprotein subunit